MNIESINQATLAAVSAGAKFLHIHQFGKNSDEHVKQLLDWADYPIGSNVYDMGSGLGELTKQMSFFRNDIKFNLINLSDEQIRLSPETIKMDFTATNLPDNSIDAAMYIFSIGHTNHDIAIREAARIIREGGVLFIYDMVGDDKEMRSMAEYSLLSEVEMNDIASKYNFRLTFSTKPEYYDVSEAKTIIGSYAFDNMFGNVDPIIFRFVKC